MIRSALEAYRLRLRRKRYLLRAGRKSSELTRIAYRADQIGPSDILCFMTVRNEALRLPFFLDHHRRLGVRHFLIVDNGSTDETRDLLRDQADVSLWQADGSYKASRFGIDWLTALQWRYGPGHWCLTLDADETLIYPDWERRPLPVLTDWLAARQVRSFGAMLLDVYPKGLLANQSYEAGQDPTTALGWFDPEGYRRTINERYHSTWIQGGVRDRVFFADRPERAPTLNKVPLVHWRRGYAYVTSTHHMLPRHLNRVFDGQVSGVLLHSKFLHTIGARSAEERDRREHFENSALYADYYDRLIAGVDLWHAGSMRYTGWQHLVDVNLMSGGDWYP